MFTTVIIQLSIVKVKHISDANLTSSASLVFGPPPTPEGNIWLLRCSVICIHKIHTYSSHAPFLIEYSLLAFMEMLLYGSQSVLQTMKMIFFLLISTVLFTLDLFLLPQGNIGQAGVGSYSLKKVAICCVQIKSPKLTFIPCQLVL